MTTNACVYVQDGEALESVGHEQGQGPDVKDLQQRIEELEKELAESENTHRLR